MGQIVTLFGAEERNIFARLGVHTHWATKASAPERQVDTTEFYQKPVYGKSSSVRCATLSDP